MKHKVNHSEGTMAKRERIDIMVVKLHHKDWATNGVEVEVKGLLSEAGVISAACDLLAGFRRVSWYEEHPISWWRRTKPARSSGT